MQKYQKNFMGIDVSKPYFDVGLMPVTDYVKGTIVQERFANTLDGLKLFSKWLKSYKVSFDTNTILVIENTGVYHRLIQNFCNENNIPIHIGNATHIKWSFGIARGKNDKIDSIRLCKYAYKHEDDIKANPVLSSIVNELKDLQTLRTKLIQQKNSLVTHLNELKLSNMVSVQKSIEKVCKNALDGIKKSIEKVELSIKDKIKSDEAIQKNYRLLLTIPGIGPGTALMLVLATGNFIGKPSGKQLASYAGVVPFEHSSGISVKGKMRVHKMANKELKCILHMCALSAIQHYSEFSEYYHRKTNEGKHALSTINAVKNKILLRVVAVVNKGEPYVDKTKENEKKQA
jgi:transposase